MIEHVLGGLVDGAASGCDVLVGFFPLPAAAPAGSGFMKFKVASTQP
jgi:hypothetical protein